MLNLSEIQNIMLQFGLSVQQITNFYDTSHNEDDKRLNYILDNTYVLKVNSITTMWEERLQEIRRLILRYRSIDVYCPDLFPTLDGNLSYVLHKDGRDYICFVEEYARYPAFQWGEEHERKEVMEHLGVLAAKYTGVDLSAIKSMWSIIDLAPLDVNIDEKQEIPYYKRIVSLFQYPNVCSMIEWLQSNIRRKKCVELIQKIVSYFGIYNS